MSTSPPDGRVCTGGPLDGQHVTVNCPHGFLAADKQAGKAWRYKAASGDIWLVDTAHDDSLIYPHGTTSGERRLDPVRAVDAAVTHQLPVIAVPGSDSGGG